MTAEERLEKLETELRRAKRRARRLLAGASLLVGIGLLVWTLWPERALAQGTTTPGAIRANSFVLVDARGKVRGALIVGKYGPFLSLRDENGKLRAALLMDKDGRPALVLQDENGKLRAALGVGKGGPELLLYDANGKITASL